MVNFELNGAGVYVEAPTTMTSSTCSARNWAFTSSRRGASRGECGHARADSKAPLTSCIIPPAPRSEGAPRPANRGLVDNP